MAVLLSTDVFSLIDDDLIVPIRSRWPQYRRPGLARQLLSGVPEERPDRRPHLGRAVPAFDHRAVLEQGRVPRGRPRSRPAAGHLAGTRRVRRETDATQWQRCTRWGTQIPGTGFTYWLFQALATEAGATLANADGTATDFASPACVEALRYWIDLSAKYQAHPPGIVDWGTTPRDFLEQKAAMIWTTTGNLSNIRANAKFPFGVAMLPADKRRGSPTGGGNFYLFRARLRRSGKPACGSCAGSAVRNARRNGASTPAMSPPARTHGRRAAMREYVAGFPGRRGGARSVAIRGGGAVHA